MENFNITNWKIMKNVHNNNIRERKECGWVDGLMSVVSGAELDHLKYLANFLTTISKESWSHDLRLAKKMVPSIYPTIYPFIHPFIYIFIHPSVQLFIHLSIHPSIHPSIYLSIYLSIILHSLFNRLKKVYFLLLRHFIRI